MPDMQ